MIALQIAVAKALFQLIGGQSLIQFFEQLWTHHKPTWRGRKVELGRQEADGHTIIIRAEILHRPKWQHPMEGLSDVQTTLAPIADGEMTIPIHAELR